MNTFIRVCCSKFNGESLGDFEVQSVSARIGSLLHPLGINSCAVVGHDLGGAIGVILALTRPKVTSRLAFLDMLLPGFGFEDAWIPRPEGRFLWFGALNSVPGVIESLFVGREREYIEFVIRAPSADLSLFDPQDLSEYTAAYRGNEKLAALGGYFRAMWANAEAFQELHSKGYRLSVPSLAVGGALSTADSCGGSLRAFSPNASQMVMAQCGHWLAEEQTELLAQILMRFLD